MIDRPFDAEILEAARKIVARYSLLIEPDPEGGFVGSALELPTVFDRGETADQCFTATVGALTTAVATLLEIDREPPVPVAEDLRTTQMNIRLTAREKLLLERSARQQGYRGVSDFVRNAALTRAANASPLLPARRRRRASEKNKR